MGCPVVVTGGGILSALGDEPAELHDALVRGSTGFARITEFPVDGFVCRHAASIPRFAPEDYLGARNFRPLDRTGRLASAAAQLALGDSGLGADTCRAREIGLVLGTMFGSVRTIAEFDRRGIIEGPEYVSPLDFANTVICAAAGQVAITHGFRGANTTISCGAASGLRAIGHAARLIQSGRLDAVLAGGAEEFCYESFYGFLRAGRLCQSGPTDPEYPVPFDRRRNGYVLGEGAAFVMLEAEDAAAARGACPRARIDACQSAFGAAEDLGGAVAAAIGRALQQAGVTPAEIDAISTAGSGSPSVDRAEACGIARAFGEYARVVPSTALKAALGETNGAAGALQLVAMLESQRRSELPGVANFDHPDPAIELNLTAGPRTVPIRRALVTAVDADGHACALVLSAC